MRAFIKGAVGSYRESINPASSISGIMVEQTKYEVLKKIGKIEIRRYPSFVIAKVEGYRDGGSNFLFRFISGYNRQKLDIGMTAPVVSEEIATTRAHICP